MPGKPGALGRKTIQVWSDCHRISIRTENISCVVIREYVEEIWLLVPGIGGARPQQGTRGHPSRTGNHLSPTEQRDASARTHYTLISWSTEWHTAVPDQVMDEQWSLEREECTRRSTTRATESQLVRRHKDRCNV